MFIDKQLQKETRSRNLIIFNSVNIGNGNMWASKEAKLMIRIAFFFIEFMQYLVVRFWPHAVQAYERWERRIA